MSFADKITQTSKASGLPYRSEYSIASVNA